MKFLQALLLTVAAAAASGIDTALADNKCATNEFVTGFYAGSNVIAKCSDIGLNWGLIERESRDFKKNRFQCGSRALAVGIKCNDAKCQQPRLDCSNPFRKVFNTTNLKKNGLFFESVKDGGCTIVKMNGSKSVRCTGNTFARGVETSDKGLTGLICCKQTSKDGKVLAEDDPAAVKVPGNGAGAVEVDNGGNAQQGTGLDADVQLAATNAPVVVGDSTAAQEAVVAPAPAVVQP